MIFIQLSFKNLHVQSAMYRRMLSGVAATNGFVASQLEDSGVGSRYLAGGATRKAAGIPTLGGRRSILGAGAMEWIERT
jgi:hypothetical protein